MGLYALVELNEALPEENLPTGVVSTIVHVLHRPELAYETEFTDNDGRIVSSVALIPTGFAASGRTGPHKPSRQGSVDDH